MKRIFIKRRKTLHILPAYIPHYWQRITRGDENYTRRRDWQLVLQARNIPYIMANIAGIEFIYVPPVIESIARSEIFAFMRENKKAPKRSWPVYPHAIYAGILLLPLTFMYALENDTLINSGALIGEKIRNNHELTRIFTALTLHADMAHLIGNLIFGAFFLAFLARLTGYGRAFLLMILGGALGNLFSVFLHAGDYASLGFSTSLFACIGGIGGVMIFRARDYRQIFIIFASVVAFLALLGTEGEHTDYVAHICGLCAGLFLGLASGWRIDKRLAGIPQIWAAALAYSLPIFAWLTKIFS